MGNRRNKKRKLKYQLRGSAKQSKLNAKSANTSINISDTSTVNNPDTSTNFTWDEPEPIGGNDEPLVQPSASEKKLHKHSFQFLDSSNASSFLLIDCTILCEFLNAKLSCSDCGGNLKTNSCFDEARGFCYSFNGFCYTCQKSEFLFSSSKRCAKKGVYQNHNKQTPFEVNVRMVSFVREIGLGLSALEDFSKCLNSPPPMNQRPYDAIIDKLLQATKSVAISSMNQAAAEVIENQNGDIDTMVSVDGSWQRRGHSSHNGIVTAINVASGKVLDVEILTNYCRACSQWSVEQQSSLEYKEWKKSHHCNLNHSGSAASMEPEGALRIFSRSIEEKGLRYTQYLGDGDSASYLKVRESKPYGDIMVTKAECIGHIQKRVGARLRRLCTQYKGKKLDDEKPLTGKNRLTNKTIDTLQNYFGMAIRHNTHSLPDMVNAVWASLYHVSSTNENPNHTLCPTGDESWCKWQRDPVTYQHKHGLPAAIVSLLEPIYEDLSDAQLLAKCLHGNTQNANECFNKVVWSRCPKEVWVGVKILQQAVYAAVSSFNDGSMFIIKTLDQLGIDPGNFSQEICQQMDKTRIEKSKRRSSEVSKSRRKTLRAMKKGFQDKNAAKEGPIYDKGTF